MDPLTSLKVFVIAVMSFTLVAAFRRFILETPPSTPSARFLLLMRENHRQYFRRDGGDLPVARFHWLEIARNTCGICCGDWRRILHSEGPLKNKRQRQSDQFIGG